MISTLTAPTTSSTTAAPVGPAAHRPAVTASFALWGAAAGIAVLSGVLVFLPAALASAAGATETAAGASPATYAAAGALMILVGVVNLVLAFRMRAGRNVARITLTGLAVLQTLSTVLALRTDTWSAWVGTAIAITATVLMYLPTSNRYF